MTRHDPYPNLDPDEVRIWVDYRGPAVTVKLGSLPPRPLSAARARQFADRLDELAPTDGGEEYADPGEIADQLRDLADEVAALEQDDDPGTDRGGRE